MFKFIAKMFGGGILESAFGMVGDWMKDNRKLKQMEASLKQTVVLEKEKRLTTQATADIQWDIAQVQASDGSWKDEAWTLTFIAVFIASFIAPVWAAAGWATLAGISTFWQYSLAASIAASFGTKELFKHFKTKG